MCIDKRIYILQIYIVHYLLKHFKCCNRFIFLFQYILELQIPYLRDKKVGFQNKTRNKCIHQILGLLFIILFVKMCKFTTKYNHLASYPYSQYHDAMRESPHERHIELCAQIFATLNEKPIGHNENHNEIFFTSIWLL